MYVPLAVALGVTVPLGAKMASWIGVNHTVAIGMVLISIGMWHGTIVEPEDPYWSFLIGLVIVGLGSGSRPDGLGGDGCHPDRAGGRRLGCRQYCPGDLRHRRHRRHRGGARRSACGSR